MPERPDLPHDSDCAYRFGHAAECTCDKDYRPYTMCEEHINVKQNGCEACEQEWREQADLSS